MREFLTGRTQSVCVDGQFSGPENVEFGVPQGSILGLLCFNIYTASSSKVPKRCGFKSCSFADDSNCRKKFSLTFQYSVLKYDIDQCMQNILRWMNGRKLKINPEKTEIGLFHPNKLEGDIVIRGTHISGQCIRFSNTI